MKAKKAVSGAEAVDAFIADHPLEKEMLLVRVILLAAAKGVSEHIKWKAPSFCLDGEDRITFDLRKGTVNLIFHRGVKVKDTKSFSFKDKSGLVKWLAPDRGVVVLGDAKDIKVKKAALALLAKDWLKVI